MFKLTKQEQRVAAFLLAAVLLGVAVKEWRVRHPKTTPTQVTERIQQ